MTTQHAGIVWNPSKTSKEQLQGALGEAAELCVSWFETSEEDPGGGAAQRAVEAGADVVLAAGGDGTVRAVAEYLAGSDAGVDLGIIPLGTGNLLARNLGVPVDDLGAAFERALHGEADPIDIGWVMLGGGDEPRQAAAADGTRRHAFAVMAGFGLDAHMITETDDDLKDRAGWLAYVESLGRAFSASEVIGVRLTEPDGATSGAQAHTLIIGNCGQLQAGVTFLPDANPADGELDLLVLSADSISGWADTLKNFVWDNGIRRLLGASDDDEKAKSTDSTAHRRVTGLLLELSEPRVFEVDGDTLGETSRIEITVQAAAVRVR